MSRLHLPHPSDPPAFVGREAELALLGAALEHACAGRGSVALLSGEPGIGKTRIAEELSGQAIARGAQVLWGRCHEGGGAPAFWPWVQLIRAYLRTGDLDAWLKEAPLAVADVARLVPELAAPLPDSHPGWAPDDEQARFRLFESVTTFFVHAAQVRPLVLVLDDIHWADTPSLRLLEFLAHELKQNPFLVIGAYRDSEVGRDHVLARTLVELNRLRVAVPIDLDGLKASALARFVAHNIGRTPSVALLDLIMEGTAGNPFFVMEVTQPLARADAADNLSWLQPIPRSVRSAIRQRLDRLSPLCNSILNIAAVLGRDFGFAYLLHLDGFAQEVLLTGLDEAVDARLISLRLDGSGRYRFVHALVRETLYDELPTSERMRLHRQIGAMLEMLHANALEAHVDELAYHFGQAAMVAGPDKALAYTMAAAQRNMRVLAYEEASRQVERALQFLDLKENGEPIARCELLLALGLAETLSGEMTAARSNFEQAAALARQAGAGAHFARAALGYAGEVVTPGAVDARAIDLLTNALSSLGRDDGTLRVRLLGRLAMEYRYAPETDRREQLSREAVLAARKLGERSALVFALNARHFAILGPDTLEQRMAISLELAQLAQERDDWELTLQSLPWRLADLLDLGHVQAADAAIETAARLAEEFRRPLYRWYVGVFRTLRALMKGEFSAATHLAQDAHALGTRVQPGAADVYYAAQMFVVRREQGQAQEVEQALRKIATQYPAMPVIRCMLAVVDWQAGRTAEASAELATLCANGAATLTRDQLWLGAVAFLAEVACGLGDRARAAALYELLLPYAQRNVVVGVPICVGAAATYLGCLAATLERWPAAAQHFEAALALNARLGTRPYLAHTQVHYAAMLLQRGQADDRRHVADLVSQAMVTAKTLGMTHLAGQADILQAELAQRRTAVSYPEGLTPRESEVLRLIAAGKSNKELAALLVISEPTVERHVTNLYAKIKVRSRAEATAYAIRSGLA